MGVYVQKSSAANSIQLRLKGKDENSNTARELFWRSEERRKYERNAR